MVPMTVPHAGVVIRVAPKFSLNFALQNLWQFHGKSMSFIVTLQADLIFSSHEDAPYWKIQ